MLDWWIPGEIYFASVALLGAAAALFYQRLSQSVKRAENAVLLIDNLSEGVYSASLSGTIMSANRAMVSMHGFASESEMLAAFNTANPTFYVDPKRRAEFQRILTRDGFVQDFVSEVYRHKTSERIWISENARMVLNLKTGVPGSYEGSIRDITESIRKRQVETRLNKLADMAPGGLFQLRRSVDGHYTTLFLSQPFRTMAGIDADEKYAVERPLLSGVEDLDLPDYLKALNESRTKLKPWHATFRYRRAVDAPLQWLDIKALPESTEDGAVEWYGCMADVTEHKELVQRIERLAYYDPLTDLPNRRLLMNRLGEAAKLSGRRRRHGGLLFLDLDGFKSINDTYGHDVGDVFITEIAGVLQSSLRESDTVARLGGDEFVILLHDLDPDCEGAKFDATMVATKIMANLRRGVKLNGVIQSVGCSIGITVFKGGLESPETLIKNADKAMYKAKDAGRNRFIVYEAPKPAVVRIKKTAA